MKKQTEHRKASLVVHFSCAAMLALSGCTTMQTVEPQAASELEPGQTVFVSLRDGSEVELSFMDWTSEGLTGTDETGILQKYESEDIARVGVQRYSTAKSVGLGVAVVAIAAGIAAAGGSGSGY